MIGLAAGLATGLGPALRLAPWGLAGAAAAAALWFRGEAAACRAETALAAARAQERLAAARTADAALTRALEAGLRPIVTQLQEQSHATQIALATVRSDARCARTPAAAAFDRGVRAGAARPAAAGDARPAGP